MKGIVRVAAAVPQLHLGNVAANVEEHLGLLQEATRQKASLVVFPELSLTGYSCGDLFYQDSLLQAVEDGLQRLCESCPDGAAAIVGAPLRRQGRLLDCAVVVARGRICSIVPKTYLPNTNEFYEKRWFDSGDAQAVFSSADGVRFGVELCEDLWSPLPPSTLLAMAGCDIVVNLSASNELIAKREYRRELVRQQSARCLCGYVYVSAGTGESTTDLIFSGHSMAASCGVLLQENENYLEDHYLLTCDIDIDRIRADRRKSSSFRDASRIWGAPSMPPHDTSADSAKPLGGMPAIRRYPIETLTLLMPDTEAPQLHVPKHPFIPSDAQERQTRCEQIFAMQAAALGRRMSITGGKLVVGISGGLDSTLALLVSCRATDGLGLPRTNILGVTMPCFGTSDRTHSNAWALMDALGIQAREIDITEAVRQHLRDIGHDETDTNVTYENAQARERTQVLMDVANDFGGIVLGTGDLSEIALGWCTYNADHMSMYGVNSGVPKTLVRWIVQTAAQMEDFAAARPALLDILDTPISPELLPPDAQGRILQQTEELVGPYELHDFFLYHTMRFGYPPEKIYQLCRIAYAEDYDAETVKKWLKNFYRRFFSQQFKRSCMPDGVKIGSISLSPRGDWRMPSDAEGAQWLSEADAL